MTASIRPVCIGDTVSLREALDSVAREKRYLLLQAAPSLEELENAVLRNLKLDIPQFVAVVSDKVVGWCDISPKIGAGFTHVGRVGMGVISTYRRQGLGQRLLEAAMQKAVAQGAMIRLELEVFSTNREAIALYEKCGFRQEGWKKKARYLDGVWDDIVLMSWLQDNEAEGSARAFSL